ncbi:MAG TPA: 30S ribosomal protein S8e [archaeon]|nr:30S ribosomal protein S8e [archaeon]
MQWHLKSKTKKTGKKLNKHAKKFRMQKGRDYLPAKVGKGKVKEKRVMGGSSKFIVLSAETANVLNKGKYQKSKILGVSDNPANSQFVRRNIVTKGAIINTELGTARVTSRPGQTGVINAVFMEQSPADTKRTGKQKK